jgi:NTE family protein
VLSESRSPGDGRLPDLLGEVILAAAIASLVLGIVNGQEWGWTSARVLGAFLASLLLGGCFAMPTRTRPTALIDLSLLRIRAFAASNATTLVMATGFYAYTLCNVLFLTEVWHYSILQAGLALTPGPVTAMVVAGAAGRVIGRVGHRPISVVGALIWACGMGYFASSLGADPDFLGQWLPGIVVLGVGAGLAFPSVTGVAVLAVPGHRYALASALNSVARQLGAALGVALLVAIVGNPSPAHALQAFRSGWVFAACCFLAGACGCVALKARAHVATEPEPMPALERVEPAGVAEGAQITY